MKQKLNATCPTIYKVWRHPITNTTSQVFHLFHKWNVSTDVLINTPTTHISPSYFEKAGIIFTTLNFKSKASPSISAHQRVQRIRWKNQWKAFQNVTLVMCKMFPQNLHSFALFAVLGNELSHISRRTVVSQHCISQAQHCTCCPGRHFLQYALKICSLPCQVIENQSYFTWTKWQVEGFNKKQ